jgi:hypothetical protein
MLSIAVISPFIAAGGDEVIEPPKVNVAVETEFIYAQAPHGAKWVPTRLPRGHGIRFRLQETRTIDSLKQIAAG